MSKQPRYLWRVLIDGTKPPQKYEIKKEKSDCFLIYAYSADGERHVIEVTKPLPGSNCDAYSLSSEYYLDEERANAIYRIKNYEKEERRRQYELEQERKRMIEQYPLLAEENQKLRQKLLSVTEYALNLCDDDECAGDMSVGLPQCEWLKDFSPIHDCENYECELKRILRTLKENDDGQEI